MSESNDSNLVELRDADKVVAIEELYSLIRRIVELELVLMDFKMWLIDRITEIGKDCVVPKDITNVIEYFTDTVRIKYTDLKNKLDYITNVVFKPLKET
jgi:RIO-like serine/threonine protein kinase